MEKRKIKTRQLTVDAMLAAMCAVLGCVALDTGSVKITFESLPVLLAALMYGPVDGVLVGLVGTLIYQIIRYGFSVTTALWILPYAAAGLVCGYFAKANGFNNNKKQIMGIIICSELIITALNTLALYVDSKVFAYFFPGFIAGALLLRVGIAVVKSIVFGLAVPPVLKRMSKITGNGRGRG